MDLVPLLQTAKDGDGVLDIRLADIDLLEPAFESLVLFDIFLIFGERRRADGPQGAAGECRLEHIGRVDRALAGTGPDQRMQLINEQNDLALGLFDLVEHRLEPILKFAAVLGTGEHRTEIERYEPLVLERFGHVAGNDALGQALDDGGLADAGLADQHRIILGASRKYLDRAAYLVVTADHRVELALAGSFGQVLSVFFESLKVLFGILVRNARAAAKVVDDLVEIFT